MNLILFDQSDVRENLMPFSLTRPVSEIRVGILTLREKWNSFSDLSVSILTADYLREKYPTSNFQDPIYVDSSIIADDDFVLNLRKLPVNHTLISEGQILAARCASSDANSWKSLSAISVPKPLMIRRIWNIFQFNGEQIRLDYKRLTQNRRSNPVSDPFTRIYHPENIFVEEGVTIKACTINAETGPVYLGKNSQIMEGAILRGPFALGEGAIVSMGAIIRGDTTIGPFCRVGGEINNSVFFSYSNKAHDGFLGNAVVGSWCNLGAGTTSSNLKNNFKRVKIWNQQLKNYEDTGLQFCGLMMGDHATAAINTSFNTATWVGTGARVIGSEFPPAYIPPFVQGGASGFRIIPKREITDSARRFYELKKMAFLPADKNVLDMAYDLTSDFRNSPLL